MCRPEMFADQHTHRQTCLSQLLTFRLLHNLAFPSHPTPPIYVYNMSIHYSCYTRPLYCTISRLYQCFATRDDVYDVMIIHTAATHDEINNSVELLRYRRQPGNEPGIFYYLDTLNPRWDEGD